MDGVWAFLLLDFLCFGFLLLLYPSLFKRQENKMTNFEAVIAMIVLVSILIIFLFPELRESLGNLFDEIFWGDFCIEVTNRC